MRLSDLSPHADTLAAVVLGALLATVSGVIANLFEARIRRRERERAAALLFGEVLSTLRVVLEGAEAVRGRGDPYGPVTRRMLRTARRELDIYDRNREALMDLQDYRLRADLNRLAVRLAMPLDGMLDSFAADGVADEVRDRSFAFMRQTLQEIAPIVARLGRVAGASFDHYDAMPRPGTAGA